MFKNIRKQINFGFLKVFIKNYWLILSIFLIGLILRLIYLHDTIAIGKDQVDHISFAHQIWENHGYIWHGARVRSGTNAAGQNLEVYLGPFYAYLLFIPALINKWSFYLPTLLSAFLGAVSIPLIYYLAKLTTNNKAVANIAALFFSLSTAFVIASRTIWNPYFLPFFMLITIISFMKLIKGNQKYLIIFVLFMSFCTQLHASSVLIIPAFVVLWFIYDIKIKNWLIWLYSGLALVISYLPMIYHELKSHFENISNFYQVVFHSSAYGADQIGYLQNLGLIIGRKFVESFSMTLDGRVYESAWGLSIWPNNILEKFYRYSVGEIFILVCLIILISIIWKRKIIAWRSNLLLVPLAFFFSFLIGSMFFKYELYMYYFATIIPIAYIILAYILVWLWSKHILGKIFTIIFITFFCYINLFSSIGYIVARQHRASVKVSEFMNPDMLLKDQYDVLNFIKSDSLNAGARIEYYCNNVSDIEVYNYLVNLESINKTNNSNTIYLIISPRFRQTGNRLDGRKVLIDQIFGSLRLVKYQE